MANDSKINSLEILKMALHYDNLFWTVSTIFSVIISGLLLHQKSNFDISLSLFGLLLTIIAVYFAASFRELRSKALKEVRRNDKTKDILKHLKNRGFGGQWKAYILIFLVLELFWVRLLIENKPALRYVWIVIVVSSGIFIVHCWKKTQHKKVNQTTDNR